MTNSDEIKQKPIDPQIDWNTRSRAMLAAIVVAVFGAILFAGGLLDQDDLDSWLKDSADWQATKGQITVLKTDATSRSTVTRKETGPFSPVIKYEFAVDGATVSGETIGRPKLVFVTEEEAQAYIQNFKVGDKITVYYDPKMVTHSCLVKGVALTPETKIPLSN